MHRSRVNVRYSVLLVALCGLPLQAAVADDHDTPAGHSHLGASFNEGPRQQAYLMSGTGAIDFPITTESAEARAFFNQGVGQLHGYWYFEAERSFRQAAMLDPELAMAYWGMGQANVLNEKRARGFLDEAIQRKDKAGAHERLHIEAYHRFLEAGVVEETKEGKSDRKVDEQSRRRRYIRDLEQIIHEHPAHIEARAVLANFTHLHFSSGVAPTSVQAYEDLMQRVIDHEPLHPIHHFRIHLWDDANIPERGLDAAANCGPAAPSIAHMWHMPGHIYSKLHRYRDAAWHQEASARVDHRHMMRDRTLPDQTHNYAHNNEWLCRNLMNVGRVRDALALAKNMIELPRHPKYNTPAKADSSSSYGRLRLIEVLERFELWEELIAAHENGYLEPTDDVEEQQKRLHLRAVAQAQTGTIAEAEAILAALEATLEKPRQEANSDDAKEGKRAKKRVARCENRIAEVKGLLLIRQGRLDEAVVELEKADGMDRFRLGAAYSQAGQTEKALEIAKAFVKDEPHQVLPPARAALLFEACGKTALATQEFEKLRPLAAEADLDAPLLAHLAPIAKRLGLPVDWRLARSDESDIGERPGLDSLGPFRWQPSPAPAWALDDHRQQEYSLGAFAGRPILVIFYLGHGCLHCVEQLHAFAPKTQDFQEAGIEIIAISSETLDDLRKTLESFESDGQPMPFPLLSNDSLDVFRDYRCYDDFEQEPLHGTFLIDGRGKIRWQDVGYEPFTDVEFLLAESRRLLEAEWSK